MKSLWKIGAMSAVAGLVATAGTHAAELKLTAGTSHPPVVPWVGTVKNHVVPQSVARAKKMGHSIKWTEAYAGALFKFDAALEGIGDGLADLGWIGTLWEPNKMPLNNVTFYAPFGSGDPATLAKIQEDLHKNVPAMKKQWRDNKLVYLGPQTIDGYVVLSKKPIKSIDDLKGMKLMTPGAVARWAEGVGAVGVQGGLPVYYNNLKTGVAEGGIVPGTGILPFKLMEVAPYVTEVNLGGCICGGLTMNAKRYDGLPKELKDMFRELGREYGDIVAEQITANRKKHFAIIAKQGAKISTMPVSEQKKWAANLPNIAKQWADRMEKRGLPAKNVLKSFMASQRKFGATTLRDWDKEL